MAGGLSRARCWLEWGGLQCRIRIPVQSWFRFILLAARRVASHPFAQNAKEWGTPFRGGACNEKQKRWATRRGPCGFSIWGYDMQPVVSVAVRPKTSSDREKMDRALSMLVQEDPTLRVKTDGGQTVICGMGELHLEITVDRMTREFSVDAHVGKPKVIYLEPVVLAEIKVPNGFSGAIVDDLRARGGRIESVSPNIRAFVPLAKMLGYVEHIRKITRGTGTFSIDFARYEETTQLIPAPGD